MIGKVFFNRPPLPANRLAALPVGAVKPEGWLKEQLQAQADGLSSQLFEAWPDVGQDSGWLGGKGDAGENAPYYLDGLIPLAYQLDDQRLIGIANRFVEWTLQSQDETGWFGPKANEDWWPRMVMLKALEQHFTATGDRRVLSFMDKYFRHQLTVLDKKPLKGWAVSRAGENMRSALWLYNVTGMGYLLKLCQKLREQSLDWTSHFHIFPHIRPMQKQRPWNEMERGLASEPDSLVGASQPYYHKECHLSHGVNVAMGLKTPGVVNLFKSGFKEVTAFKVGFQKLMKHHGVASGAFSCDTHLAGGNPSQGTELCAIVELMHTIEVLLQTGDEFGQDLPDILEKLAFNALPAAFSRDMTAHQHLQQVNQVKVSRAPRGWYNSGEEANLFGLQPDFGCCTANMHQGWPKFVGSMWYATSDEGLMAVSYAPCTLNFLASGKRVRLGVSGHYPFDGAIGITVNVKSPVEFPLYLRIPGWAKQAMIRLPDGEIMQLRAGETACVRRRWMGAERVSLDLPMEPRLSRWYHQSAAVELGPLLMCYRPEEHWREIGRQNYEVTTEDAWNWALIDGESMKAVFDPERAHAFKAGDDGPGDPVKVLAKAGRAQGWGMEGESAAQPPIAPEIEPGSERVIELVPYGSSALRVAQFPLVPRRG